MYADGGADAITLLALRMLYAAPFFVAMAWWSGRRSDARTIAPTDWRRLVALGFVGYYLSSLLDFLGLQYISASLERLVLYLNPTLVLVLSAAVLGQRITRRAVAALALAYAGIALVLGHALSVPGDAGDTVAGSALVFASALLYAVYLVYAGPVIGRLGSSRFIAWAMLVSTVFVLAHFALSRPMSALDVPARVHRLALAMAVFSTVLPTWLIAESIRRMGANAASLVGSLGPVFTMALGAVVLNEAILPLQLVGAALVLAGVTLVTLKPRPSR